MSNDFLKHSPAIRSPQKRIPALIVTLLLLSAALSSCVSASATVVRGAVFTESYGPDREQVMDVYLPSGLDAPAPVLILIHGGAWHWGSRNDYRDTVLQYGRLGYAVVNMDYRMGSAPPFFTLSDKLDDIDLVMERVLRMRRQWSLSDRVILYGGSAGAHLSLQYAYTRGRQSIAAVISFFGPTDLTKPEYTSTGLSGAVAALVGITWNSSAETLAAYRAASPLYQVRGGEAPTLLLHGTADDVVPYSDATDLNAALVAAGSTVRLVTIPGGNHGANWAGHWNLVSTEITNWLRAAVD